MRRGNKTNLQFPFEYLLNWGEELFSVDSAIESCSIEYTQNE